MERQRTVIIIKYSPKFKSSKKKREDKEEGNEMQREARDDLTQLRHLFEYLSIEMRVTISQVLGSFIHTSHFSEPLNSVFNLSACVPV